MMYTEALAIYYPPLPSVVKSLKKYGRKNFLYPSLKPLKRVVLFSHGLSHDCDMHKLLM